MSFEGTETESVRELMKDHELVEDEVSSAPEDHLYTNMPGSVLCIDESRTPWRGRLFLMQ